MFLLSLICKNIILKQLNKTISLIMFFPSPKPSSVCILSQSRQMAKFIFFLFALVIHLAHSRDLWSITFPEIKDIVLEKGKPIQVPDYYDQIQLCELSGTIYSDTLSQLHNITELRICRSRIQDIEPGALCSSPTVKVLELEFYDIHKVPHLKKETFRNCNNIEELLLKFDPERNEAIKIDNDAFEELSNLKGLHFQGYKFDRLSKNFLKLPNTAMTVLAFSLCDIREVSSDVFDDFTNLEKIVLINNRRLKTVPLGLFKNQSKLKTLFLRRNRIENLTWDEFEGLNNLENLDVTENRITFFDADKIAKNMPSLKRLDIDRNPPRCKVKEAFVLELKKKLPNVEVSYKYDSGYYDSCEEE